MEEEKIGRIRQTYPIHSTVEADKIILGIVNTIGGALC
jgi:hypothetical protein